MSRPAVTIELNPSLARDLSAGGVFVPNCGLALQDECDVVVRAGDTELRLPARVVYVDPNKGNGLELLGFGPAIKEQLAALAAIPASTQRIERIDPDHDDEDIDDGEPAMIASATPPADEPGDGFKVDLEPDGPRGEYKVDLEPDGPRDVIAAEPPPEPTAESDADDDDASVRSIPRNVHERLRGLTMAEQLKIAHAGEMHERIVLERMYGKTVWEALIRNPRVTGAEIARIARMGALPRPLIELIVSNGTWLQIPEIRRSLLTNPRLGPDQIQKVLRLMPKHELKICPKQVAYPMAVRDAAKRMLLGG